MQIEEKAYSVTLLTKYIKEMFNENPLFNHIMVVGEVSNFKNSGGHLYFTLKDDNAQISCVMFKTYAYGIDERIKDGTKVYAIGSVEVYEKSGKYQLYVKALKPEGIGDLYEKYEELKKKLESKGYFDKARKKPLPKFPKNIALLTSKTGAVIEDLKSIILKRSQFSNLTLYPTLCQGVDAKYSIIKNIEKANLNPEIDVIILARGGGSIEDLWPYNEEIVADAIYNSKKPIISAVGHETDFTISDFVADLRAATPSDAALIVVKDSYDLKNELDSLSLRLNQSFKNEIDYLESKLDSIKNKSILGAKDKILMPFTQKLIYLNGKLESNSFKARLEKESKSLEMVMSELNSVYSNILKNCSFKYSMALEKLNLLNPLAVLNKGYSLTFKDNMIVKSTNEINVGDTIKTKFSDGFIESKVIKKGD